MERGQVVGGRFEVLELADSGAMGSVYRTLDREVGGEVALKTTRGLREGAADRFQREAHLLARIHHPAVVQYVAHGVSDGVHWLAMEWLAGENLARRLQHGPLGVPDTLALARTVAAGLGALHRAGVVHRDVKPANVFLVDGRIDSVRLVDFGIARSYTGDTEITLPGAMIGTPGYMAPEQARGELDIDARADVFSLACLIYRCLTNKLAFAGEDMLARLAKTALEDAPRIGATRRDIPRRLDGLLARMFAKSRSERPPDGAAVEDELAEIGRQDLGPMTAPSVPALTSNEQRVLSIVMALPSPPDPDGTAETVVGTHVLAILRTLAEGFGARAVPLLGGAIAVILVGSGPPTDQAARAARCVLSMRHAAPDVPMSLATGRGRVGDAWASGEAIDRAAALLREARARSDARNVVRMDAVTAGLLGQRFDVGEERGALALLGERDVAEPPRTVLGKTTPHVGHDRELSQIVSLYGSSTDEPAACAVLVTGRAGAGKSRLAHEFLLRVRDDAQPAAPEILSARGDPMRSGSPYSVIGAALARAAGILDGETLQLARQKLRARVLRHADALPAGLDSERVVEFVGEIVGVPFDDAASVQLRSARRDAMLMNDQLRRSFEGFLAAECAAEPVVLVLEDFQWVDPPTVALIDAALRSLAESPLYVLALARPEVRDRFPTLWADREVYEVKVAPLGKRAGLELVRAVLGQDYPDTVAQEIVRHASGNPFLLEELIRTVAVSGSEAPLSRLPESILAMVEARLEALSPDTRRVLRAASVYGPMTWEGGVRALLGAGDEAVDVRRELATLVDREVLVRHGRARFPGENEFAFRHAIVREAAYGMLVDQDRVLGHALAGEWLAESGESDALVLAEHFERGQEAARAVDCLLLAARESLAANDLAGAIDRVDRAIGCGAEGHALGELLLVQAEAHKWRGDNAEAQTRGLLALERLPEGSDAWFAAAGEVMVASLRLGKVERIDDVVARLRERMSGRPPTPAALVALSRAVAGLLHAGQNELARELLDAIPEDGATPDPGARARILQARATHALVSGDVDAYLRRMAVARAAFDDSGDRRMTCNSGVGIGYALAESGDLEAAEAELRGALDDAERAGLPQLAEAARCNLGVTLQRAGAIDEACKHLAKAASELATQGDRRMESAARAYLAAALTARGDLEGARREADAAVRTAPGDPARARALAALAMVLLRAGEAPVALETSSAAMALLDRMGGIDSGEAAVRLAQAEALHASGDRASAAREIAIARDRLQARAARISDSRRRSSFLARVPEHARTIALHAKWAGS